MDYYKLVYKKIVCVCVCAPDTYPSVARQSDAHGAGRRRVGNRGTKLYPDAQRIVLFVVMIHNATTEASRKQKQKNIYSDNILPSSVKTQKRKKKKKTFTKPREN